MTWTVFVDRDGVFDVLKLPGVVRWHDFEWLPGAREAFARLNRPDVQTCMCTNQPLVGHLMATRGMVQHVNGTMQDELASHGGRLDRVEVAYAPVWLPHRRRKPRPGMLEDGAKWLAANKSPVDPEKAVMIGDTLKDAQAAKAFGCKAILLGTTRPIEWLRERAAEKGVEVDAYCHDLVEAVDLIESWLDA